MTIIECIQIEVLTLADLEAAIKSFKITCRPSRRGRPTCGARRFSYKGHIIELFIGETCLGAGGWGMSARLMMDGKRTTLQKIAKATL